MKIQDITSFLETVAPPSLQESYDNAGLLTGDPQWECTGILTTLDATEAVVLEAVANGCNLVVAHHPIIFGGLKRLTGRNYVERTVISAIRQQVAIYAIHTNLDNVLTGVNGRIADRLGLVERRALQPRRGSLRKLVTFVPHAHAEAVRNALFAAGAGGIGDYSECSYSVTGAGTFKGNAATDPFVGTPGERHTEPETRIETIFPAWLETPILHALIAAHPYEEVAYDLYPLENTYDQVGSGLLGKLPQPMNEHEFLALLRQQFNLEIIRHTPLLEKNIEKVAICGGAGSFLTKTAIAAGADVFVTGDVKYHEFFDADGRILLADIGHFESEQFTTDLLYEVLLEKFTNFAVRKTGVVTNPVRYFI